MSKMVGFICTRHLQVLFAMDGQVLFKEIDWQNDLIQQFSPAKAKSLFSEAEKACGYPFKLNLYLIQSGTVETVEKESLDKVRDMLDLQGFNIEYRHTIFDGLTRYFEENGYVNESQPTCLIHSLGNSLKFGLFIPQNGNQWAIEKGHPFNNRYRAVYDQVIKIAVDKANVPAGLLDLEAIEKNYFQEVTSWVKTGERQPGFRMRLTPSKNSGINPPEGRFGIYDPNFQEFKEAIYGDLEENFKNPIQSFWKAGGRRKLDLILIGDYFKSNWLKKVLEDEIALNKVINNFLVEENPEILIEGSIDYLKAYVLEEIKAEVENFRESPSHRQKEALLEKAREVLIGDVVEELLISYQQEEVKPINSLEKEPIEETEDLQEFMENENFQSSERHASSDPNNKKNVDDPVEEKENTKENGETPVNTIIEEAAKRRVKKNWNSLKVLNTLKRNKLIYILIPVLIFIPFIYLLLNHYSSEEKRNSVGSEEYVKSILVAEAIKIIGAPEEITQGEELTLSVETKNLDEFFWRIGDEIIQNERQIKFPITEFIEEEIEVKVVGWTNSDTIFDQVRVKILKPVKEDQLVDLEGTLKNFVLKSQNDIPFSKSYKDEIFSNFSSEEVVIQYFIDGVRLKSISINEYLLEKETLGSMSIRKVEDINLEEPRWEDGKLVTLELHESVVN